MQRLLSRTFEHVSMWRAISNKDGKLTIHIVLHWSFNCTEFVFVPIISQCSIWTICYVLVEQIDGIFFHILGLLHPKFKTCVIKNWMGYKRTFWGFGIWKELSKSVVTLKRLCSVLSSWGAIVVFAFAFSMCACTLLSLGIVLEGNISAICKVKLVVFPKW